jgi:hypothetical protein
MTADTLSAETIDRLSALWEQQSQTGDREDIDRMISEIWSHIPSLLRLARLATPELLTLGEAAVRFYDTVSAMDADAAGPAMTSMLDHARAYAASVSRGEA